MLPCCEHRQPSSRSPGAGWTQIYPRGSQPPLVLSSLIIKRKEVDGGNRSRELCLKKLTSTCIWQGRESPSLGCHLQSFLLGEKRGFGKFPIILTVQLHSSTPGETEDLISTFTSLQRKAFVFPLNTRMTDSRALLIPGRASRALRVTKPQAMHHSGRGRGQPPVPEDGQTRCKAADCSCCPHPSRIWGS